MEGSSKMFKKVPNFRLITKKDLKRIEEDTIRKLKFYEELPIHEGAKLEAIYGSGPVDIYQDVLNEAYRMAYAEPEEDKPEEATRKQSEDEEGGEDEIKLS